MLKNNTVFSQLLNLSGLNRDHDLVMEIFELGGIDGVTRTKIKNWRSDPDKGYQAIPDKCLDGFFKGLFEYRNRMAEEGILVFNFPKNDLESIQKRKRP